MHSKPLIAKKSEEYISNAAVITVLADGQAPIGAKISAGAEMTKLGRHFGSLTV